jgi:hypothetical protein
VRRFVLLLWRVFLVIWGGGLPGVRVRAARSGEFALPELLPEFSGELPELLPEFSGELPE